MKAQIFMNDYMLFYLRDENEIVDLFGVDGLNNEYECFDIKELDPALIERAKKAQKEMFEVSSILEKIYKEKNEKV